MDTFSCFPSTTLPSFPLPSLSLLHISTIYYDLQSYIFYPLLFHSGTFSSTFSLRYPTIPLHHTRALYLSLLGAENDIVSLRADDLRLQVSLLGVDDPTVLLAVEGLGLLFQQLLSVNCQVLEVRVIGLDSRHLGFESGR